MAQGGPEQEHHKMSEKVLVQVGNASKIHFAIQFELRGRMITSLGCGAKSLRGLTTVQTATSSETFDYCEKCLSRELVSA
jgi:hypothetical protein